MKKILFVLLLSLSLIGCTSSPSYTEVEMGYGFHDHWWRRPSRPPRYHRPPRIHRPPRDHMRPPHRTGGYRR